MIAHARKPILNRTQWDETETDRIVKAAIAYIQNPRNLNAVRTHKLRWILAQVQPSVISEDRRRIFSNDTSAERIGKLIGPEIMKLVGSDYQNRLHKKSIPVLTVLPDIAMEPEPPAPKKLAPTESTPEESLRMLQDMLKGITGPISSFLLQFVRLEVDGMMRKMDGRVLELETKIARLETQLKTAEDLLLEQGSQLEKSHQKLAAATTEEPKKVRLRIGVVGFLPNQAGTIEQEFKGRIKFFNLGEDLQNGKSLPQMHQVIAARHMRHSTTDILNQRFGRENVFMAHGISSAIALIESAIREHESVVAASVPSTT